MPQKQSKPQRRAKTTMNRPPSTTDVIKIVAGDALMTVSRPTLSMMFNTKERFGPMMTSGLKVETNMILKMPKLPKRLPQPKKRIQRSPLQQWLSKNQMSKLKKIHLLKSKRALILLSKRLLISQGFTIKLMSISPLPFINLKPATVYRALVPVKN